MSMASEQGHHGVFEVGLGRRERTAARHPRLAAGVAARDDRHGRDHHPDGAESGDVTSLMDRGDPQILWQAVVGRRDRADQSRQGSRFSACNSVPLSIGGVGEGGGERPEFPHVHEINPYPRRRRDPHLKLRVAPEERKSCR